ncbi:hypothetical protein ACIG47_19165 [Promicromonospora sp. NPDC052451]|uniref:hypothetical protein n=1 Tax=Promicromonospora sp. NPDC052451 TaxID=3364407 RepID=UPI0037C5909D
MLLVALSPTEATVIASGRIYDPRYRPRPGSTLDQAETEEEIEEALAQVRASRRLDINARGRDWRGIRERPGLLVANYNDMPVFIGVAWCTLLSRSGYVGLARVRLKPWRPFKNQVAVSTILDELNDGRTSANITRILKDWETRELPPEVNRRLQDALFDHAGNFDEALADVSASAQPARARRAVDQSELPALDASQSALRFFSRDWPQLTPVDDLGPLPSIAEEIDAAFRMSEDDHIDDDASAFLDWQQTPRTVAGWFEFREGARRLLVKNINVSTAEARTGADLVYVRRDPDAVVLVQYKLLDQGTGDPYFRDSGGRLASQVARMQKYANPATTQSADEPDYRLGRDIGYVKFIVPTTARATSALDLRPEGRYHPAGSVERLLRTPDKGPKGGKVYYTRNWRYINGETFAQLVRDRWIGTCEDTTDQLLEVIGLISSGRRTCVAVDVPV